MDADPPLEDGVKKPEYPVQNGRQLGKNFRFGDFVLQTSGGGLTRLGTDVPLQPQVLALLEFLVENRDRIVSKDELVDTIWEGRIVSDAVLNTRIRDVRRALGDDRKAQRFVRTYPKRGVRFVASTAESARDGGGGDRPNGFVAADDTHSGLAQPRWRRLRFLSPLAVLSILILSVLAVLVGQSDPTDDALPLPDRPSIAVLRFESDDSDGRAFVADGLAEDLIADLSQFKELFVISRNTSFTYDPRDTDPRKLGRELGVAFVARGSLKSIHDEVRVTAELVDAVTGEAIWSERFDRNSSDVFAIQDEISDAISGRLLPEMVKAHVRSKRGDPREDLSAWDLFLQAKAHQTVFSREGQERAISLAKAALDRVPSFAAAYSLIAQAKGNLFFWSDGTAQLRDEAIQAARQALLMDPDDPVAYAALGYVYRFTGDEARAIGNLERAVVLNPNNATIRLQLAHTLDWFRHQARALPQIEHAIRLSPRDPLLQNMLFYKAHILFHLQEYEESLGAADAMGAVVSSGPWETFYHLMRAAALAELDREEKAKAAIDAVRDLNPNLSLTALKARFDKSKNHPENRAQWLSSLRKAGLPD